ncbi:MAG: DUF1015 domain-containing protein [Pseudomonadota bacterium]
MSKIIPFAALIPKKEYMDEVICPPYDVIDSAQARVLAEGKPHSLLHITKAEIDLPPNTLEYDDLVYATAAKNLARFIKDNTLIRDSASIYIYRLIMRDHTQTGVVAAVSADEYKKGLIKKHEKTREPKVVDRTRHSLAIGGHAEPVILVHRRMSAISKILEAETKQAPLYDVTDDKEVRHILWRAKAIQDIVAAFANLDALYIADGHHRSESGLRTKEEMQKKNKDHNGDEPYNFFPAVIFADDQVKVFEYNWDGPPDMRPQAKVTMADIMDLSDRNGIMPPKSTWFAPKLASGLFVYTF